MRRRFTLLVLLYALISVAIILSIYTRVLMQNYGRMADAGRIRVAQASERLDNQLGSYRYLVNLLSRDPRVIGALNGDVADIEALLHQWRLAYGVTRVDVVDANGARIASTVPTQRALQPDLLTAAMEGRLGWGHDIENNTRLFHFSRGVIGDAPPTKGVVILSVDVAELEFEWSVIPETIAFFDDQGVIFAANRPTLQLMDQDHLPTHKRQSYAGYDIWSFEDDVRFPERALVVSQDAPRIDMVAYGFLDTSDARSAAVLSAGLAAALAALFGLTVLVVAIWRRRLADRLAIEEAANARLETRVNKRTKELRQTQSQLVQAAKMSALGQMSAGISHELNQPLGAIINFAENGAKFLDLDRTDPARDNFNQISGQAERMGRIIRHLRGFARNEDEALVPVDLVQAVQDSLGLTANAIRAAGVTCRTDIQVQTAMVMGGKVRLQQVIVNLISNAVDAMTDRDMRVLNIVLEIIDGTAQLVVIDSGTGISDPEKVFEPFYTTKALGASEGLGLGLSISYGIIGSFGGDLTCSNRLGGGAEFRIALPLIKVNA